MKLRKALVENGLLLDEAAAIKACEVGRVAVEGATQYSYDSVLPATRRVNICVGSLSGGETMIVYPLLVNPDKDPWISAYNCRVYALQRARKEALQLIFTAKGLSLESGHAKRSQNLVQRLHSMAAEITTLAERVADEAKIVSYLYALLYTAGSVKST